MWAHVMPATLETEAELLKSGRQSLQLAEIMPLLSILGNRVRLHLGGKKELNSGKGVVCFNFNFLRRVSTKEDLLLAVSAEKEMRCIFF